MSIETYNELQAHLADTINRTGLSDAVTTFSPSALDSQIVRAISLAEQRVQNDLMSRGGISHMETVDDTKDTVAGTETVTMPTGFLGLRSMVVTTNPYTILQGYGDINSLFNTFPSTTSSRPKPMLLSAQQQHFCGQYQIRRMIYALSTTKPWMCSAPATRRIGCCNMHLGFMWALPWWSCVCTSKIIQQPSFGKVFMMPN